MADNGKSSANVGSKNDKVKQEDKAGAPLEPVFKENHLFVSVNDYQWPIVYRKEYNLGFLGLEKLHPFDSAKWGKIFNILKGQLMVTEDTIVSPEEALEKDLLVVHVQSYLDSLKWSYAVAGITEVPPVALLPNFIVQKKVLKPLRFQTGGTILAAKLALERGWSINIGGGFHHCSSARGGGFCAYADISLGIMFLRKMKLIKKAMIVDLDAHQGNGHERDFINMQKDVYILDVYNREIYPHDGYAKRGISRKVELESFTGDEEYLSLVKRHLTEAIAEFQPDIVFYNAGTDCLQGDPLGRLSVSPDGIIQRDEMVFEWARNSHSIPIIMVTSGGYQQKTGPIIAQSILNLRDKKLVSCEAAEEYIKRSR
ncbi:histone deacetylase 11-like isoform X2 [Apostichopus japonicus]|uniref:histone deacetylase 11-like isoform X2 n=1 Tax=Stichopus japonicus TaxID=307972 RepID=UPI003AB5FAB2